MLKLWKKWRYKYLTLFFSGLVVAAYLAGNEAFRSALLKLGAIEGLGALFAGMLFVSSFSIAIGGVVIVILAQDVHPLTIALIGGVGALIGDMVIFKLVKDHLSDELASLVGKEDTRSIKHLIHSKYIAWMLPIIGMLIIASPLPDELGVSVLGLSKMSDARFIAISYISNTLGILALASVARAF